MFDTRNICRACLIENWDMINIFENKLSEEFYICTNIQAIESDEMPQQICNNCFNQLNLSYNFRLKCEKSDKLLKDKLNVKNNIEDDNSNHFSYVDDDDINIDGDIGVNYIEEVLSKPIASTNLLNDIQKNKEQLKHEKFDDFKDEIELENQNEDSNIIQIININDNCVIESSEEIHICKYCKKMYTDKSLLDTHLLTHKRIKRKNSETSHRGTKLAKYLCSICGKGFATNQRLQIHSFTHTGERNFGCQYCSKKFATEIRLKNHLRTHTGERPYQCSICGLSFAQSNALKCHNRIHTGERPYECKICLKSFRQNTILKTHMTLHTGKTVKCPDCDKKFSRKSYLILHRREHTGEKPYACDRCPNRYNQKSHLDRHLDVHNGVKHKCNVCNKEYTKRWSLKMHMFKHDEIKPFICPKCPNGFTRRDKYLSHLKNQHRILPNNEILTINSNESSKIKVKN